MRQNRKMLSLYGGMAMSEKLIIIDYLCSIITENISKDLLGDADLFSITTTRIGGRKKNCMQSLMS